MEQSEINQAVNAAFDSVELIAQIDTMSLPLSEEDRATRTRNVEHLQIMLNQDWFIAALTPEQAETLLNFI